MAITIWAKSIALIRWATVDTPIMKCNENRDSTSES
jgi:hypothetical protein